MEFISYSFKYIDTCLFIFPTVDFIGNDMGLISHSCFFPGQHHYDHGGGFKNDDIWT